MTVRQETKPTASPLQHRLISLIKANGPITIADYMSDALGHPQEGYYTTRHALGAQGDFTTAPEISQIFGELVGLWLVQSWIDLGEPKHLNLIELGPGRGVLMTDILRAAKLRPEFLKAIHIWLVETSGRLRHEQQQRLRRSTLPIDWADKLEDVPPGPSLIVGNEFLDCLPIRQFVRTGVSWRERLVGVSTSEEELEFILAKTPPVPEIELPGYEKFEEGEIIEVSKDISSFIETVGNILSAFPGRALFFDYGRVTSGAGETLQAMKNHKFWPILASPGEADITAHVDFDALTACAAENGLGTFGPIAQGAFLENIGLMQRVEKLCLNKTPREQADIHAGALRISSPSQMGQLFKAICLTSPAVSAPPGF